MCHNNLNINNRMQFNYEHYQAFIRNKEFLDSCLKVERWFEQNELLLGTNRSPLTYLNDNRPILNNNIKMENNCLKEFEDLSLTGATRKRSCTITSGQATKKFKCEAVDDNSNDKVVVISNSQIYFPCDKDKKQIPAHNMD